jgi:hypothetical protein
MKTKFARTFALSVIALSTLTLAGCGKSGLSGTYGTQAKNDIVFNFHGNQVDITKNGETVTGKFSVKDKVITVFNPQGEGRNFKIDDNGCIYDGGIMIAAKACKQ